MQQATSAYGFSGVTFWLDAAYGLNTQTNLGAVSSWQQRVGGGTFVQATAANQPRLILNDANYNNLPSVQSVDFNRAMIAQQGTGLKVNPQITIAVVSKVDTINGINGIIGNTTGITADAAGVNDGGSFANYNGFGYTTGNTQRLQGTTESTNPRIKILTSTNIIINGVIETTGSFSDTRDLNGLFGVATGVFQSTKLIGSIAEIIAFGYSMTSDEAIALSNNINQKYALY